MTPSPVMALSGPPSSLNTVPQVVSARRSHPPAARTSMWGRPALTRATLAPGMQTRSSMMVISVGRRDQRSAADELGVMQVLALMIASGLAAGASVRLSPALRTVLTSLCIRYSGESNDGRSIGRQSARVNGHGPRFAGGSNRHQRRGFTLVFVFKNGFSALTSAAHYGRRVGNYYDPFSGCHFVIARPSAQPELWSAYLGGARASYRRFGVERVLEYEKTRDGTSTALFFAALDGDGQVAGGMRAQGPYMQAAQAHALVEWAGRDGAAALRNEISERIPSGVIEMKTGWVKHGAPRRPELTAAIARVFVHSMTLLGARHALGTVAAHAVARWQTTGGTVSRTVAPVAYPDDRYLTSPMWWDRETYADLAAADQLPRLIDESAQLNHHDRPGMSATTP